MTKSKATAKLLSNFLEIHALTKFKTF